MSLLSSLLDHMPPPDIRRAPGRLAPALTRLPKDECTQASSAHLSAATATPEWLYARDEYLNHLMVCRACYAPAGRYCMTGAELHVSYGKTPMESPQESDD